MLPIQFIEDSILILRGPGLSQHFKLVLPKSHYFSKEGNLKVAGKGLVYFLLGVIEAVFNNFEEGEVLYYQVDFFSVVYFGELEISWLALSVVIIRARSSGLEQDQQGELVDEPLSDGELVRVKQVSDALSRVHASDEAPELAALVDDLDSQVPVQPGLVAQRSDSDSINEIEEVEVCLDIAPVGHFLGDD